EIPKELKKVPKKGKSFFGGIYETAVKLGDQIEDALTFNKEDHDDHEKAEALVIVEESASPEKCEEIISNQKDDGCIELNDSVCNELDAPKEEVITTIQEKITNDKLKSPSILSTAINLSYLKNAASQYEDQWRDKYNKAREYLSKQIGDANAEKELIECADNYVVENCTKKVIKDKKRNAVVTIQDSTTPEKCEDAVSNQKDDGSFEISETICNELDIPATNVVTTVKKSTKNKKLKSPECEPWWKTALTISYLKVAAPKHENLWKDKYNKACEYLSKQIGDADAEKEILDCTDKFVVDNITKKVEDDHKKTAAIAIIQESASPEKSREIVSNQKDDGCIELDDSVCNELDVPKEEIITTIKEKVTNPKLKLPEFSSALATAINLSYLKNVASQHKGEWEDKYNKAREYLSKQIGDKDAEEELIKCADNYVVDKATNKIIEEHKEEVITLKKDEIPKELKKVPKKGKSFFGGIYEAAVKLGDQIENAITFYKEDHDDHEKAEALVIVEESASPEKCKEIISNQKDDGCIELNDSVCNELDAPKEEVITTFQEKITNDKLKSPSILSTAINLSYLKNAASQHEDQWRDKYNKAREYLSKQIGDANAEKELIECADNYVVENCTKKVIKDKKRNAVVTIQDSTTPEKCEDVVSNQNDDGSFEVPETVCKELDVPVTEVVTTVTECTENEKLKSPECEPWWKTALTISYLKVAAPKHENQWKDKYNKALEYLSKQIGDANAEKELLECTDKYVVDNITKKVEDDHKKAAAIAIIQESASPEKSREIISNQKEDGSIELDDSVCNELDVPKETIITTIKKNITNAKLQLPEFSPSLATAINLSYLKNAAPQHKGEWEDKYNKAREYLSKQIGDKDAEEELLECTDKYVVYKITNKVIEEQKKDVIAQKEDEIPKELKATKPRKGKSFFDPEPEKDIESSPEEIIQTPKSAKHKSHFGGVYKEPEPEKNTEGSVFDEEPELQEGNIPSKSKDRSIPPEPKESILKEEPEPKDRGIPEEEPVAEHYETARSLILDRHIEDIISDDKEPDQSEKVIITQTSITPEICKAITSTAGDDGRIELNETICKELDLPKEEIITTIQKNITNSKLKLPNFPSILATALNLSYLKNAAPQHKGEWDDKYNKAREYITNQIGDADAEKELLEFTDNYVIDNCAKKAIKDKKRSAIVHLQTSTTPDKYKTALSNQKDDGSLELNETISEELDVPKEDIVTTLKSSTTNEKLQSPESDSWWKTALIISYLQVAAPHYEDQWKDKYIKAREYLSKQIDDKDIENELLKCTNKYVVDRANEKAIRYNIQENVYVTRLDFTDETLQAVHEGLRSSVNDETARVICGAQQDDGSFTLHSQITNHLGIEPVDAIKSLKRFVGNPRLRGCDDSIWCTAFTIYYIEVVLLNYENECRDAKDRARKWLSEQINDAKLEKELFSACKQFLIEQGCRCIYSIKADPKNYEILKLNVDDETRKIFLDTIRTYGTADIAQSLCSAQENNGSFSLNTLNTSQLLIPCDVESLKRYVGSLKLRTCADSIWHTAFIIYYLKFVLADHEEEWRSAYDRASAWITEQIDDAEAEKELYSACEQYLIQLGIEFINNQGGIKNVTEEEVNVVVIQVSDETREAIHKSLRDDVTAEVAQTICNSQADDGSFTLHRSISDHLKIHSIDNAVDTLKSFVGSTLLRSCDSPIWCTALTIKYLRIVLADYEQEWRPACERAEAWISKQCKTPEEEEELYSACDQFIIKQGIDILNEKNKQPRLSKRRSVVKGETIQVITLVADEETKKAVYEFLRSQTSPDYPRTLTSSQENDGSFALHTLISEHLQIPAVYVGEPIKRYVRSPRLRGCDASVWNTAFTITYLNIVLNNCEPEWKPAHERATNWVTNQINDSELEKELFSACEQYLLELGFDLLNNANEAQTSKSVDIIQDKKNEQAITQNYTYDSSLTVPDFQTEINLIQDKKNEQVLFVSSSFTRSDLVVSNLSLKLTKSLGLNSVEKAKKHFSSYSPRIAQLDANVWSTAISIWYLRYVLVDFRSEWVESHQKAYNWLCQQVKGDDVREELLEAARIFVVKRFEVDQGAIQEDETFKEIQYGRRANFVDEEPQEIEEFVSNDEVVGIVKIGVKCAKDLRKSDNWFTFSNPDPYIRIFNAAGNEMVRTSVNYRTANPVWNEIYFVAIRGPGEKISFEIFDENRFIADKSLGTYVLDTSVLVQSDEEPKLMDEWVSLQIGNKPVKGKLNLQYQFFPTSFTEGDDFVFTGESIKPQHLYILISWRNTNRSFEFSDKLARFFNYRSCDELKESFTKHVSSDKDLLNYDLTIWSTALTITYFKGLCWEYYDEWRHIIEDSEAWVSREINNVEIEDRLYDLCRKFFIAHFKINIQKLDKAQLEIITPVKHTIITRKFITIRYIRTLINHQNEDGCIVLNEKVADYYGFKSVKVFLKHLKKYFKTERVTKIHYNVWVTACTIWYLRLVAVDHRLEWISNYEKLSEWLTKQCNGDTELENEIMRCARDFIVSRYEVDKDAIEADNSFITAVKTKDVARKEEENETKRREKRRNRRKNISLSGNIVSRETTNDKTVKDFITCCTKKDHYQLDDNIAQHLGFLNKESLEAALRIHFLSEDVSKLHSDILITAISIWYLRLVAVDHRDQWSTDCDTLYKWISSQIKNPHIERKLYGSSKIFVINQYKINDDVLELDAPYQDSSTDFESAKTIKDEDLIIEPIKKEELKKEPKKSLFGAVYKATAKLGDKIEDALTFNKDDHEDHEKAEAFIVVEESVTPEKCKRIISAKKDNDSIELNDSICNELDVPKEDVIKIIQKKITNNKLKTPELSKSLATAINISYLQKAASKHKDEWEDKYNKAREYLSNQIGDKAAEEELIECADNYVVDNVTNKVIEEQKEDVIAIKEDEIPKELKKEPEKEPKKDHKSFFGGIYERATKLGDQIENALTFNKEDHDDHEKAEALIIVEESATPEKCKEIISDQKDDGCIELSDSVSASQYKGEWEDKYNKAREYLSKQIGDDEAEKELIECADNYVVENCIKKVIKDKKRNSVVTIQDLTTPEKCEDAITNQKDDGSFEISETICNELDIPAIDVVTKVKKCTNNKKLKSPECEPWWKTELTISYLKVAAPKHENLWKDKYNKACEYLSKQIGDANAEKEILDCTDKYVVDNITKKVEKDHKKNVAITIIQESASPEKSREIVSKQKEDGSIELDDSVCNELNAPKEEIITTVKKNITNIKLQLPDLSSSLATAINLSYLKNAASQHKGEWEDKYNKAREYLSKQIGDKDAEEELLECTDKYVVDNVTNKVIEEQKKEVIALKKDEVPEELKSKKGKSFFGGIYEAAAKLGDQIEDAITFNKDDHDDHEKAEALIIVEESATPEKCKEIISDQKEDGCIELSDSVCDELDTPKEEIITTIQEKITNDKLKSPSILSTAINLSYLKKAASKHKGEWIDKYNKAREYLSKQIDDADAEKELLECADDYVIENCTKKVIKNKKRNSIVIAQNNTTPEKCEDVVSNQKNDGSFEVSETICKELDVPVTEVVTTVTECTESEKLKSPECEPWWKTALTVSYLKVAAPKHENQWKDKYNAALKYLSKQIGDANAEKEILDCTDKYIIDNITKKVEKDHKKNAAITIIQESASPEKSREIVSNQKEDGSIELDDSVCNELDAPKEEIITTITKNITNAKLKLPELSSSLATAINLSYLKNAASQHKDEWEDKYNKAREYLSNQIGDKAAEEELIECADNYVVDNVTNKVIEEQKEDVIAIKEDEIPKELKKEPEKEPKKDHKSFFGGIYERATKLGDQIENALTFNKEDHDDHEKAEALIIVEESATPEKCKEIISDQKDDGCIELSDSVSASQYKGEWEDKYNKAREYLSKQIGDDEAEKELIECADNYVVENCIKKVIKDKKRNSVVTIQDLTTPEKCEDAITNQKDDGSFEISETICNELDIPAIDVVTKVKKCTNNKKLKSPECEPWWKTELTISYLKVAAPKHENLWKDKYNKACEYLSKQIGDANAEKEILDCTDKYVVDNITKKVEKDHKKNAAITIIQESASPEKSREIVSEQKEDGSIELDDSVCNELDAPKETIITTIISSVNEKNCDVDKTNIGNYHI
ncbi:4173_t:CDS:10, partial [Scutellospora calospora]